MAAKKYVQSLTQYLAGSGTIIGATSVVLTSLSDIYGNAIANISSFGDKGYITLEPDTTNEEAATFTSITVNANGTVTLGGVSTILAQSPYTETSGLIRPHSGGTKVVITDNVAFWNTFANKYNNEVITGLWTAPTGGTGSQIATATDIATAITGASGTATNLVNGTVKLSVAAASAPNPIVVGDNDTRVPTIAQTAALVGNNTDIAVGSGNKVVTQTGLQHNAEKYCVDSSGGSTAYVGTLSPAPTSLTDGMVVYVKIGITNSTTTPTFNLNGLGAKTIVKLGNVALAISDIPVGENILIYDLTATKWVLQSPIANVFNNSSFTVLASASAIIASANTTEATSSTSYVKVKQFNILSPGTYTITYTIGFGSSGGGTGTPSNNIEFFKNGIDQSVGDVANFNTPVSSSKTFTLAVGDTIEIWMKYTQPGTLTTTSQITACDIRGVLLPNVIVALN